VQVGRAVVLAVLWIVLGTGRSDAVAQAPSPEAIRAKLESLRASGTARFGDATLVWSETLGEFYSRRQYTAVWTDARAADLVRAIDDIVHDGLDPAEYHRTTLASHDGSGADGEVNRARAVAGVRPLDSAELELVRTDALLLLVHDLGGGKLNAENPSAGRDLSPRTRPTLLQDLERAASIASPNTAFTAVRPTHFIYTGLRAALAEYRRLDAQGEWRPIAPGPTIRPGNDDTRVAEIRERLMMFGDLPANAPAEAPAHADEAFVAAARNFQRRHSLNADGVIGPATLAELNVPPGQRIEQIRINLERARWYTRDLPRTFVAVNIAGAMAYLVRDGSVAWESRAIVGRVPTRTPIFRATMTYIDLNPTWTVPRSIVGEILADIRRDPDYMRRVGMRVIDGSGRPVAVDREQILRYGASDFPWVFRQDPGPANPLGRIKLMFPNRYNVYLHDTPSRTLFDLDQRLFSHGCVRLQDPVGLAVEVLSDEENWNRAAIQEAIDAGGTTRTVPLATPIEVLVLYWTAATDEAGELRFHRDVYDRDAAVARGLGITGAE